MANIPHEVKSCCKLCGTVLAFHLDTVQPLALMNALKSNQKAANYYAILKHPVQHNGQHHRSQSPEHEVHSCTTMDSTTVLTHLHSIIPSVKVIPFTCFTHTPMVKYQYSACRGQAIEHNCYLVVSRHLFILEASLPSGSSTRLLCSEGKMT